MSSWTSSRPLDEASASSTYLSGTGVPLTVPDRATGAWAVEVIDAATNLGGIMHVDHSGVGGTSSYGIDIRNRPAAGGAFVIHNYSDVISPVQIDNTASKTLITLRNTENAFYSPGTKGTGAYIQFIGYPGGDTAQATISKGTLDKNMKFSSMDPLEPFMFYSSVAGPALKILQDGPSVAFNITAAAGAVGLYIAQFVGQDYGPKFSTFLNGGDSFTVEKDGTGTGVASKIINKGTGLSLDVRSAAASLFAINAAGIPQWVAAANQQTTVGAAGAASALPATPSKYLLVKDSAGTSFVIPCYAAA